MDIESLKIQTDWCDMQFHEHLKRLRQSKGLTQNQVADEIGIAKNTYIGYENGNRDPRLSELKKLAILFGMTLSELCMETDSRSVDDELVLRFQAVKQFDQDELKAFNTLIEAMLIRHHANKARTLSEKTKAAESYLSDHDGNICGKCGGKLIKLELSDEQKRRGILSIRECESCKMQNVAV